MTAGISALRILQSCDMELKPLDWFLCVAETGSLSKASLDLDVSQSMLSRGIHDLEQELGQRLFHRTGRGMYPTEFGKRMLPIARRAILEVSRFNSEAKALRGKLSGTVAIGLPGSVAARMVAPLVKESARALSRAFAALRRGIERRHRGATCRAQDRHRARVPAAVAREPRHGAARTVEPLSGRTARRCGHGETCGAACAGRRESRHAARPPALGPNHGRGRLRRARDGTHHAVRDRIAAARSRRPSRRAAAIPSPGFDSVANDVAAGRLQAAPIKDPTIERLLVMTTGPKNSLTTAARAIAGLVVSVAAELVRKGTWRAPDP